jgi:hypothetical protein
VRGVLRKKNTSEIRSNCRDEIKNVLTSESEKLDLIIMGFNIFISFLLRLAYKYSGFNYVHIRKNYE